MHLFSRKVHNALSSIPRSFHREHILQLHIKIDTLADTAMPFVLHSKVFLLNIPAVEAHIP